MEQHPDHEGSTDRSSKAATLGARQSTLRELNLALVARTVFAHPGELTRADVAQSTGMTRSTVSRLVDDLLGFGLLAEDKPPPRESRGRPGVPLRPASGTHLFMGLEVNVGYAAACLVDLAGTVIEQRFLSHDFSESTPAEAMELLAGEANALRAGVGDAGSLHSVRLALPGLVDGQSATLLRAPNLGWRDFKPFELLGDAGLDLFGLDFGLGNEADFAALTVAQDAPGRIADEGSFLYISGSVGVGSACVRNGVVLSGRHGWAGEIGHVCVDPDGPLCGCGASGCLEAVAGMRALLTASGRESWQEFVQDAAEPDQRMRDVLDRAGRALGIALATTLNLLDIPHVVLGGTVADLSSVFLPMIERELSHRVLGAPYEAISMDVAPAAETRASLGAAYAGVTALLGSPAAAMDADPS